MLITDDNLFLPKKPAGKQDLKQKPFKSWKREKKFKCIECLLLIEYIYYKKFCREKLDSMCFMNNK